MRRAFTMLEIVFVLVITGLLATVGSMSIVQIMQNYAIQKEYAKLELDSASLIRQISGYLQNSVWESIAVMESATNYTSIRNINAPEHAQLNDGTQNELVFIEKNMEAMDGYFDTATNERLPLFSGFVDLQNSKGQIITTVSPTDRLNNGMLQPRVNSGTLALYFPFIAQDGAVKDKFYTANATSLFKVAGINTANSLELKTAPARLGDIATIVNTDIVRIVKDGGNLCLTRNNAFGKKCNGGMLIAQGVKSLSVWSEAQAGLLRVRVCFENKTMDFMPEFCKEGVIMQ